MSYPAKTVTQLAGGYFFFAAALGALSLILAVLFMAFALGQHRLAATVPVMAEVTEKTVKPYLSNTRSGQLGTSEMKWVALRVRDGDKVVNFGLSPNARTYADLAVGQSVLVRFDPVNPLSSALDSEFPNGRFRTLRMLFGAFAGAVLLAAVGLFALGRATGRRIIRIRDTGLSRSATVIAHEADRVRERYNLNANAFHVTAVWLDDQAVKGRTFEKFARAPDLFADLPPVGSILQVYVDPDDRTLSFWEADVGARLPPPPATLG